MSEEYFVLFPNGTKIDVGTLDEVRAAREDISQVMGGSSGGGRWSFVYGFTDAFENPFVLKQGRWAVRIAREAHDLRVTLDDSLSSETRAFLDRLIWGLLSGDEKDRVP